MPILLIHFLRPRIAVCLITCHFHGFPNISQISGTLGTGLFLGSGKALNGAGPLGALLAYALIATVAYS